MDQVRQVGFEEFKMRDSESGIAEMTDDVVSGRKYYSGMKNRGYSTD